jgi:Heparinase II/III-like protein/Heparinase II/III N-terminus
VGDETGHLLERLRGLGHPVPHLMGPLGKEPTPASLQEGRFEVYGIPTKLNPPIDWLQDPNDSRTWRYQLHSLTWLKPIFLSYAQSGDRTALAVGVDILIDWISAHLHKPAGISEFAWYDMAVSQRAPSFAYALRAGLAEDMLDGDRANLLLQACNRHGMELADADNYSAGHNHGLAQDEGLYLLASQIPVLPAAPAWSGLAIDRLQRTMRETICEREGGHLEHSTGYQFAITRMMSRLIDTVELPGLPALHDRLRETAAWQVMPNGRVAQLGDTDDESAEKWAIKAAAQQRGISALLQTGYAFVRDGGSYLALSAGFHSPTHKHADDTGILLVEDGKVLLGDAGRWGYYEQEDDRRYARSAHAHNVLTVDGEDFAWRKSMPYKSGLLAAGEGEGWYAILATNPLLLEQGVEHRRILIYRPAVALIAIDDVRADGIHEYARRFHFGSAFEAVVDERNRIALKGDGIAATLSDFSEGVETELDRGRDNPTRLGWTYPGDRERLPIWTATMRSRGADATLVAALTLGEGSPGVAGAAVEGHRAVVELDGGTVDVRFAPDSGRAEVGVSEKR